MNEDEIIKLLNNQNEVKPSREMMHRIIDSLPAPRVRMRPVTVVAGGFLGIALGALAIVLFVSGPNNDLQRIAPVSMSQSDLDAEQRELTSATVDDIDTSFADFYQNL